MGMVLLIRASFRRLQTTDSRLGLLKEKDSSTHVRKGTKCPAFAREETDRSICSKQNDADPGFYSSHEAADGKIFFFLHRHTPKDKNFLPHTTHTHPLVTSQGLGARKEGLYRHEVKSPVLYAPSL